MAFNYKIKHNSGKYLLNSGKWGTENNKNVRIFETEDEARNLIEKSGLKAVGPFPSMISFEIPDDTLFLIEEKVLKSFVMKEEYRFGDMVGYIEE